ATAKKTIQEELNTWAPQLPKEIYQDRIRQRVGHDLELLQELGHCPGIENYSAHFEGRQSGQPPFCLFNFFDNNDFLLIIDESHIAIPQLRGMYAGDRARKKSLIEYGFRLPSAYDNRPLKFEEIEKYFNDVIFVSATPSAYEREKSTTLVEQVIRPTGLVDPTIHVLPREGQITHLINEIKATQDKGLRTLVTVMTKKMAEDMARYLQEQQLKVCYLHSELKTPQRTELLQKLRLGIFDCLVGVNLLREGLDLPEVALVAIMDADLESFLRDKRSLIQIIGRAARNTQSKVLMFADRMTDSMHAAIDETNRRRTLQQEYNEKHGITPETVQREVTKSISNMQKAIHEASTLSKRKKRQEEKLSVQEVNLRLLELEQKMKQAAEELDFETAIRLRDEWHQLKS
ncbi:MAG: helicase-related protein, partial [Candidatus Babeliales bacterium]